MNSTGTAVNQAYSGRHGFLPLGGNSRVVGYLFTTYATIAQVSLSCLVSWFYGLECSQLGKMTDAFSLQAVYVEVSGLIPACFLYILQLRYGVCAVRENAG